MADNNEGVLRRSLDAVDRHRTRLLIGLAVGGPYCCLPFTRLPASSSPAQTPLCTRSSSSSSSGRLRWRSWCGSSGAPPDPATDSRM
jgi:hypothetical protein